MTTATTTTQKIKPAPPLFYRPLRIPYNRGIYRPVQPQVRRGIKEGRHTFLGNDDYFNEAERWRDKRFITDGEIADLLYLQQLYNVLFRRCFRESKCPLTSGRSSDENVKEE